MSNYGLEHALQDRGVEFIRSQVGDRHIQAELLKRRWTFGGESSGHILCLNKTTTGDAIVAALQVLWAMQRNEISLAELSQGMQKLPQVCLNVCSDRAQAVTNHPKVIQAQTQMSTDLGQRGRILLRPSGTEPLIRVMVEGEDEPSIQRIAEQLAEVVTRTNAAMEAV